MSPRTEPRLWRRLLRAALSIGVLVAIVVAVEAFVARPYRVPSGSMEPTLRPGDRILVNRLFGRPHVGEIVVFHPPAGAEVDGCGVPGHQGEPCRMPSTREDSVTYVKRIVAGPGDRLGIVDGRVVLNGRLQAQRYVRPCRRLHERACTYRRSIVVPAGFWFVMGDNRADSNDSRFWGPVPTRWLIGAAVFRYWPPGRLGSL